MAIGSSFAAMNTMYAAVARRAREIGTLRVLGFSKGGILTSFLLESLLLSLIGGVVGGLPGVPWLNNITNVDCRLVTFSQIAVNFRVTAGSMLAQCIFGVAMGLVPGFFPA